MVVGGFRSFHVLVTTVYGPGPKERSMFFSLKHVTQLTRNSMFCNRLMEWK